MDFGVLGDLGWKRSELAEICITGEAIETSNRVDEQRISIESSRECVIPVKRAGCREIRRILSKIKKGKAIRCDGKGRMNVGLSKTLCVWKRNQRVLV